MFAKCKQKRLSKVLSADKRHKLLSLMSQSGQLEQVNPPLLQMQKKLSAYIRSVVAGLYDAATAEAVRIQYGGSVKPNNVAEYYGQSQTSTALLSAEPA